jgi:HTH-type transcriptional regulator/antitoxin HigA
MELYLSGSSEPINSMTRSMRKQFEGLAMNIKPIRTTEDHRAALKEIETLMMAEMDTPEGDRLDVLATLVEAYEAKHFPMELPDAIDAIKFTMEQKGLTPKDLQPMIGRLNRVYEILSGKRPLTLPMIWRLHEALGIPAEALIKPSRQGQAAA